MTTPGLPPITDAVLPPAVRNGSVEDKKAYKAALGFERMMVGELLKQVNVISENEDTPAVYRDLLPQTLADSLIANGGIGLAPQLFEAIKETSE